jgi:RNA polymerase sigma factor (sigma-70 family)
VPPVNPSLENTPSLSFDTDTANCDDGLSEFAHVRPRLFGIAYRMLRSAADAEDIVQNVWVSWQCTNRSAVENPSAFLTTTTTRLCINLSQCAHSRRETLSGIWHLEPVDTGGDPEVYAEREQQLKVAMLRLEALLPTERAAYVLREAFGYSYRQIANILEIKEANSRQLVSRARKHLTEARHAPAKLSQKHRLLQVFMAAAHTGHMASLEDFFVEEVFSYSSGRSERSGKDCSGRYRRKRRRARIQERRRYARQFFATATM